jgi:hypothetical protein
MHIWGDETPFITDTAGTVLRRTYPYPSKSSLTRFNAATWSLARAVDNLMDSTHRSAGSGLSWTRDYPNDVWLDNHIATSVFGQVAIAPRMDAQLDGQHAQVGRQRIVVDQGPLSFVPVVAQTQCRIWYRRYGIESRSTNQNCPFRNTNRPTRRKSDRVATLQ